jgi:hypothetical protein
MNEHSIQELELSMGDVVMRNTLIQHMLVVS